MPSGTSSLVDLFTKVNRTFGNTESTGSEEQSTGYQSTATESNANPTPSSTTSYTANSETIKGSEQILEEEPPSSSDNEKTKLGDTTTSEEENESEEEKDNELATGETELSRASEEEKPVEPNNEQSINESDFPRDDSHPIFKQLMDFVQFMKITDLKKKLRELNLPVSGNKPVLMEQLGKYILDQNTKTLTEWFEIVKCQQDPINDALHRLKVPVLRQKLKSLRLSWAGSKAKMIKTFTDYVAASDKSNTEWLDFITSSVGEETLEVESPSSSSEDEAPKSEIPVAEKKSLSQILYDMTMVQLKQKLKKLGQTSYGVKAKLVGQLLKFVKDNPEPSVTESDMVPELSGQWESFFTKEDSPIPAHVVELMNSKALESSQLEDTTKEPSQVDSLDTPFQAEPPKTTNGIEENNDNTIKPDVSTKGKLVIRISKPAMATAIESNFFHIQSFVKLPLRTST